MNKETLEKLSYYELKEIIKGYCISSLGKSLIDKIVPSTDLIHIEKMLNDTSEGRRLLDASYHMPLEGVFNITPFIKKMDKGMALDPSDLTTISDFLRGCRKVKNFIKDKEGYAKTLSAYGENIADLSYIEEEINNAIKGSRVDSNATKDLRKIRRNIENCQGKIKEKLDKYLKSSSNKECIQEFFISIRNGRYTIPIKSSYKNQIKGTIVEASSRGNTVFVELDIISKLTLELTSLRVEESMEEYKILANITNMIYERIRDLKINVEIIAKYDMILAKAKYSKEINGIKTSINGRGHTKIIKGKYPLIKDSIPLDIEIGEEYRTLIITGPNAGGKTVVLKTLGMLNLAVQSGFHIGASEGTEISIFNKIFVDIGDNQSVENSLSTFSSHVKNLATILKESNKETLLLFDEIGSGTEPNEGAALAIAILEEFYHKGCITVASTHYGEIKNFSEAHPHFQNAAMEFKKDTLEPLYRLILGKTGDSNALYISKKMGISDTIIERTRKYIDNKNYNLSTLKGSKITKTKENKSEEYYYDYKKGDKVMLLEKNEPAIVYKERDKMNNITVFYNKNFLEVNYKRTELLIKAEELYPVGYDLNQIFVSFAERKFERDIERGSKKTLKKIRNEGYIKEV